MSDIVERLRSVDVSWSETGEWCAEAAHVITELRSKNARLVAEIVAWLRRPRTGMGYVGQHLAEEIEAKWGKV